MDQLLERLSRSYSGSASLETLTRPLLDLGQQVTGMESVYLTAIDETEGVQKIIYSRNSGALQMQEGLEVPWQDTLCRRALNEGRFFTDDVPACWGDSSAARALGIRSYLTLPVFVGDNELFGTLCAASSSTVELPDNAESILSLCVELIAKQVERELSMRESARQATEAQQRLERMALIADISRYCLHAPSVEESVLTVAERLSRTGFWEKVVPMRLRLGRRGPLGERDPEAARLASLLIKASPGALDGMVYQDQDHVIFPPEDLDWIKAYRRRLNLGDHGDAALLVVSTEEAVEAGLLILSSRDMSSDPDERQLLNTIANSLSLLASRLLVHERLEAANAELQYSALHDALTGLPNRRSLIDELERMLARAERSKDAVHVALIDLDDFKAINDQHGHDVGDAFLRQYGERLRQVARQGDLIARYGGDEFVFVGKSENPENASAERDAIVKRIRHASSGRYELDGIRIDYGGPSLGMITWHLGDRVDPDITLARADEAMYADKQARRSGALTRT